MRSEIAVEKLSLKGVIINAGYHVEDNQVILHSVALAKDNKDGVMEYFEIGSEEHKKILPELE